MSDEVPATEDEHVLKMASGYPLTCVSCNVPLTIWDDTHPNTRGGGCFHLSCLAPDCVNAKWTMRSQYAALLGRWTVAPSDNDNDGDEPLQHFTLERTGLKCEWYEECSDLSARKATGRWRERIPSQWM